MGKMKWIYQMVQDGTSEYFMKTYLEAKLANKEGFMFDSQYITILKGRSIVREMKKVDQEYNRYIDRQAEYQKYYGE